MKHFIQHVEYYGSAAIGFTTQTQKMHGPIIERSVITHTYFKPTNTQR